MKLLRADCHVHSDNSGDGRGSIKSICRRAVEIGLLEIVFTEHIDFQYTDRCYGTFDYGRFMREIAAAREEFSGRLNILAGAEIDFQARYRTRIEDFLSGKEFDYLLGAAHYVDGQILSEHKGYFIGKTERDAYLPYFEVLSQAVNSGLFDAIAHLDLCKRYGCLYYGPFRWEDYEDEIHAILRDMVRLGLGLEVNTSGLRQPPREMYPDMPILEIFARMGGARIVIGSDAHDESELGEGIDTALEMARRLGLEHIGFRKP